MSLSDDLDDELDELREPRVPPDLPEGTLVYFANSPEVEALRDQLREKDRIVIASKPGPLQFAGAPLELQRLGMKPAGLWYACGLAWLDWLSTEQPNWGFVGIHKIGLDLSRMVVLPTLEQLIAFHNKFGHSMGWESAYDDRLIHWTPVAQQYGGIEICPYQWRARRNLTWYYSWDVASGCIWDPSVILWTKQVL